MLTDPDPLTEAQRELIEDMDDVNEHVHYEFDPDEYQGVSTCGFAHVANISGNSSFVRRVMSLADRTDYDSVYESRNGGYIIEIGGNDLSLRQDYDGGYRLSMNNVSDLRPGPEMQRMDVRERLHGLLLERLQYHGYCEDARVKSRMD